MDEPIRVAHVMGKMVGGGVESVVMNYFRHIDRKQVQFDFIVDQDSTLVPSDEITSLGGRVFTVPPYQRLISYQKALISLFRQNGWAIVHSHINTLSVFSLRAAKRAGVPVRIAHSHATAGKGELVRNATKLALRPFANLYPTHRLACSSYAGNWLFGSARFEVLVNAFNLKSLQFNQESRDEFRKALGIDEQTFVFGHAGRFAPPKNQARLIRMFKDVALARKEAMLVLAGQGPDMQECERLSEDLGIVSRVIFAGQQRDMAAFYSGIDAFVLPSAYEGLGLVLVEAQDAGLPCIASNEVSREADVTNRVVFVDYDNDGAWIEAMKRCQIRPDRSLGNSERKALSTFDIETRSIGLMNYYRRCIDEIKPTYFGKVG